MSLPLILQYKEDPLLLFHSSEALLAALKQGVQEKGICYEALFQAWQGFTGGKGVVWCSYMADRCKLVLESCGGEADMMLERQLGKGMKLSMLVPFIEFQMSGRAEADEECLSTPYASLEEHSLGLEILKEAYGQLIVENMTLELAAWHPQTMGMPFRLKAALMQEGCKLFLCFTKNNAPGWCATMNESLVDCLDAACFMQVWTGGQQEMVGLWQRVLLQVLSASLTMEAFRNHNFRKGLPLFLLSKFKKDAALLEGARRRQQCSLHVLGSDHLAHILKHYRSLLMSSEGNTLDFAHYLG